MKRVSLAAAIALALIAPLTASGPVGVFAVIEKVVFEPDGTTAANAERVQVWGAFSYVEGGIQFAGPLHDIERGYMYFTLPKGTPAQVQAARNEWADLKGVAGTGQGVAFGQWIAPPQQGGGPLGVMVERVRWDSPGYSLYVQKQLPPQRLPTLYITNTGIVKLPDSAPYASVLKRLRDASAAKSQ
jgi:hypothetical protein